MATIGSTVAPSTNTTYYDALLSTTLAGYVAGGTMFDNIFKDSAFLTFLRQSDSVKKQNGGERIALPLMYGDNSTIKSYSGEEVLDTTLQDGFTTAFYEWKELGGTIGITRKEERQNSGEGRLINLLESKIKQAEMTMRETLNTQLIQGTVSGGTFVPGNDGKDLYPLAYFLRKLNATNPTVGGNVGNISAAESWWRHHTGVLDSGSKDTGNDFALSVTTYAGMESALKRMYNFCSRGSGGSPDLALADQVTFETYENSLNTKMRYTNTKMADMGFDTIKLRGATMIWDESVPSLDTGEVAGGVTFSGTCFFLNTKFYHLVIDSQTDIVTTPFVEPENQTVKTAKILFMGNAAISNMRKHGVVYAASQSIAA
jgi:hypothetical protein